MKKNYIIKDVLLEPISQLPLSKKEAPLLESERISQQLLTELQVDEAGQKWFMNAISEKFPEENLRATLFHFLYRFLQKRGNQQDILTAAIEAKNKVVTFVLIKRLLPDLTMYAQDPELSALQPLRDAFNSRNPKLVPPEG